MVYLLCRRKDQTLTFKSWLFLTSLLTSYCCCLLKNYFVVNKFENLFLPLVFFTVQFSKSCPTPFGRFRSLKSACLVYQPSPFPSSVFCAFFLIFFSTFPLGSNIPPLGSALPSADFANYTHLSPFVNAFLSFRAFFLTAFRFFARQMQKSSYPPHYNSFFRSFNHNKKHKARSLI